MQSSNNKVRRYGKVWKVPYRVSRYDDEGKFETDGLLSGKVCLTQMYANEDT